MYVWLAVHFIELLLTGAYSFWENKKVPGRSTHPEKPKDGLTHAQFVANLTLARDTIFPGLNRQAMSRKPLTQLWPTTTTLTSLTTSIKTATSRGSISASSKSSQ